MCISRTQSLHCVEFEVCIRISLWIIYHKKISNLVRPNCQQLGARWTFYHCWCEPLVDTLHSFWGSSENKSGVWQPCVQTFWWKATQRRDFRTVFTWSLCLNWCPMEWDSFVANYQTVGCVTLLGYCVSQLAEPLFRDEGSWHWTTRRGSRIAQ